MLQRKLFLNAAINAYWEIILLCERRESFTNVNCYKKV